VKKPLILFVNGGSTDLQVLIQENGEYYRVKIKDNIRAFHQALLDGKQAYHIANEHVTKQDNYKVGWQNGQPSLSAQTAKIVDEQSTIQLVPAKLLRVVEKLKRDYQVIKAVVFYTHREKDRQEPIAVGEILADWLKDYFGLTTDDVSHVNILPNRKRIEGPDERDYPVNRDTVKIIDQTVHELAEATDKNCIACVSASGMQDVKNLIKACVRFHFSPWQERFMEMEVKEREDEAVEINQIPTAVDSFHAREHAIALIRQGDFAGAYGAVKHLEGDPNENVWVKKVADVSDYFGGQLGKNRADLADYLEDFTNKEAPRCLLVAMRTETALLSGHIADAISLTITFWDAAILDAINKAYPQEVETIEEVENRIVFSLDYQVDPKLIKGDKPCVDADEFPKDGHYRYNLMGSHPWIWLKLIDRKLKQAKDNNDESPPNLVDYLKAYSNALDKKTSLKGHEIPIRAKDWRNVNTHSLLKLGQSEIAETIFIDADLWTKKTDAKPIAGSCFLAQDLVDNVLKELGQTNVSQRYDQLIKGVCGELANPSTIKVN